MTNYRDCTVELSDDTLMRIGVCQNCKALLDDEATAQATADHIMEKHIDFWAKFGGARTDKFRDLKIVDINITEERFEEKRKARTDEQEAKLQEQKDNHETGINFNDEIL